MGLRYFKRFRMEINLARRDFAGRPLPPGYELIGWRSELLEEHADTKFLSFRDEIDAHVFPCFTDRAGCLRLMEEISRKSGFLPRATWLARYVGGGKNKIECCGTIQGIEDTGGYGAIQNVGITPFHRGRGLGTALVYRSLAAFQDIGLKKAYLEVTAHNRAAIRLYQRLGFAKVRTLYKAVEVAYT